MNFNRSRITIDCVHSILGSVDVDVRVIVVDNSTDLTEKNELSFVSEANVTIIHSLGNVGYVRGINTGIQYASDLDFDYLLILNNDTLLDSKALWFLTKTAKSYSDKCIVSGKVYNIDKPETLQYIGQSCRNHNKLDYPPYVMSSCEYDSGQYDMNIEMDMLDDIYWLLPKEVYRSVGLYDERFYMYGEQNDYALRAKKAGFRLVYCYEAKLWHYHHLSASGRDQGYPSILYWKAYAVLLLLHTHTSKPNFWQYYFKGLIKSFVKCFINSMHPGRRKSCRPNLLAHYYYGKYLISGVNNAEYNPYLLGSQD